MDRRQQYREQTRQEAKRIALEQLASDGIAGISINAIGKRMGITGPALYRYFANRDALLTELISDAYHDLADTIEAAIAGRAGRLRAAATAMRTWALREPHRYLLIFGTPVPGYQAPAHTLDAASRSMAGLLAAAGPDTAKPRRSALYRQVAAWGERMHYGDLTPRQLHWGLTVWTRLHGVISLEVAGQFALTQVDPELLFKAEVDALAAWWAPESYDRMAGSRRPQAGPSNQGGEPHHGRRFVRARAGQRAGAVLRAGQRRTRVTAAPDRRAGGRAARADHDHRRRAADGRRRPYRRGAAARPRARARGHRAGQRQGRRRRRQPPRSWPRPAWRELPFDERAAVLLRAADLAPGRGATRSTPRRSSASPSPSSRPRSTPRAS